MQPTHQEIDRAFRRVLEDLYAASGQRPGVPVPSSDVRGRLPMSDGLWRSVSADLRHLGIVLHDGNEGELTLTAFGAGQAAGLLMHG